MNILITGGGTGGHLSIAKALGIECKKRGWRVIYVGSTSGQDQMWFQNSDIFHKSFFLETTGVVNKRGLGLLRALRLQMRAILQSRAILRAHRIDCAISVGGFSAGGASLASVLCRVPLFIHEQNAIKGKLNAILSPFARAVFGSFGSEDKNFIHTSYPINDEFFHAARTRSEIQTILFLGGSQGARAINDFALESFQKLRQMGISIIHQCGSSDFERVKMEYEKMLGDNFHKDSRADSQDSKNFSANGLELFDFSMNLAPKMARADFCISRAGASSIWEICANGLGAYFVPYPYAAKDHQYFNAMFLKNLNLCEVTRQNELNFEHLARYISNLNIAQISSSMRAQISPNGAAQIINHIENYAKNGNNKNN